MASQVTLLDGSIGHLLKSKGLDSLSDTLAFDELFAAGSLANLKRPDIVRKVHEEYVQFCHVMTTNAFGCTKFNLDRLPGTSDHDAIHLAVAAAKIARGVADACDRQILVAGENNCKNSTAAISLLYFYFFRCLNNILPQVVYLLFKRAITSLLPIIPQLHN